MEDIIFKLKKFLGFYKPITLTFLTLEFLNNKIQPLFDDLNKFKLNYLMFDFFEFSYYGITNFNNFDEITKQFSYNIYIESDELRIISTQLSNIIVRELL